MIAGPGFTTIPAMSPPPPVRIAVVNDYDLVVAGIAALLEPYADRIELVELDTGAGVRSEVDVILYDTFAQVPGDGVDLVRLMGGGRARVVIFSWTTDPMVVRRALERGASAYLSKEMGADELVAALERVHAGEQVVPGSTERGDWPGRRLGLTPREAEVLALITQGLSNAEIAEQAHLSINSVKSYVRAAYRKVGVSRRSQAVAWGMAHGFAPDRGRQVLSGEARADA